MQPGNKKINGTIPFMTKNILGINSDIDQLSATLSTTPTVYLGHYLRHRPFINDINDINDNLSTTLTTT